MSFIFGLWVARNERWTSQHWNGLCSYKPTKTEENRHALDSAFTAKFNHISRYFFVIITFKEANLGRSFLPSASTTNSYDVRKSLTISKFERTSKNYRQEEITIPTKIKMQVTILNTFYYATEWFPSTFGEYDDSHVQIVDLVKRFALLLRQSSCRFLALFHPFKKSITETNSFGDSGKIST